ncbi:hypothetical protein GN958_ATG05892, partial [Phytophthora infestans]
AYFFAITDAVRKVSDPQDTCTYSGSEATKETNTGDLVGSGVNFFVGFLILVFIRRVLNQRKNRYRYEQAGARICPMDRTSSPDNLCLTLKIGSLQKRRSQIREGIPRDGMATYTTGNK